jgi:hypothetical protein
MYSFSRREVGRFVVQVSNQKLGDVHRKRFKNGVTPQNQETINVYVAGNFTFSIGSFNKSLTAGSTSLDLEIDEFPEGEIAVEQVVSPTAIRYCVSAKEGKYEKAVSELSTSVPLVLAVASAVFVLSGTVTVGTMVVSTGGYVAVSAGASLLGNGRLLILS